MQREIRSLQRRVEAHQKKLGEYKKNPFSRDNKKLLTEGWAKDNPERQQKIIDGRIEKIEHNIKTWQKTIDYDKKEIEKLQAPQVEPKRDDQTSKDLGFHDYIAGNSIGNQLDPR